MGIPVPHTLGSYTFTECAYLAPVKNSRSVTAKLSWERKIWQDPKRKLSLHIPIM